MIPVAPIPEPEGFDAKCRTPGNKWLKNNPGVGRPRDYWSPFKADLMRGFYDLCGYSAMHDLNGTVDHYRGCTNYPELSYEWSNYRYASAWINSSKSNKDEAILDPYDVKDGWFEIILPSLQLVAAEKIPPEFREKIAYTIKTLHLQDDERVIRQRRSWYKMYSRGEISLERLRKFAPLLAQAVEREESANSG